MYTRNALFDFDRYPVLSAKACAMLREICGLVEERYDIERNRLKKYSDDEEELLAAPSEEERLAAISDARSWISDRLSTALSQFEEVKSESSEDDVPVLVTDVLDADRCPDIYAMWNSVYHASFTAEERAEEYTGYLVEQQIKNLRIKQQTSI